MPFRGSFVNGTGSPERKMNAMELSYRRRVVRRGLIIAPEMLDDDQLAFEPREGLWSLGTVARRIQRRRLPEHPIHWSAAWQCSRPHSCAWLFYTNHPSRVVSPMLAQRAAQLQPHCTTHQSKSKSGEPPSHMAGGSMVSRGQWHDLGWWSTRWHPCSIVPV